jgi:Putative phage metallopeptidase
MPKTYEDPPKELTDLIAEARRRFHPVLERCEVTIAALLEADIDKDTGEVMHSLKANGYPAAAMVKATNLKERSLGLADALMLVDRRWWEDHPNVEERLALVDHELTHLQVCADPGGIVWWNANEREVAGKPKADDRGRPKLKLQHHDFQIGGFIDVARRHKQRAVEVQQVEMLQNDLGQWAWDFIHELAPAAE